MIGLLACMGHPTGDQLLALPFQQLDEPSRPPDRPWMRHLGPVWQRLEPVLPFVGQGAVAVATVALPVRRQWAGAESVLELGFVRR